MHLLKRERRVFVDPTVPDSKGVCVLTALVSSFEPPSPAPTGIPPFRLSSLLLPSSRPWVVAIVDPEP